MAPRCLIVDDNEDFLVSSRRLLETQGIRVAGCATSGGEALQLLDELRPDIALVDVELGEEDGIAIAEELARRSPGTTVVLISAHEGGDLDELLEGSRVAGFLPKTELRAAAILALTA